LISQTTSTSLYKKNLQTFQKPLAQKSRGYGKTTNHDLTGKLGEKEMPRHMLKTAANPRNNK
jgi:hypothetical protein